MKPREIAALFGLAALWGSSFLFVRLASPAVGPFFTAQGRVTIAAAGLFIYILMVGESTQFGKRWRHYLIIGALNAGIPFTLVSFASLHLNASIMAIINSLTPLFTALVVWGWMKERPGFTKCSGIITGMIGVTILVGWSPVPLSTEVLIAIGFSILSTVSYGFGGVYATKTFKQAPPLSVAFGQQMGASLLLIPFTVLNLPESTSQVTPVVAWSIAGVAILSTAMGYLLYYYLIKKVGPTKTVSVTFLIPLFSMVWAVLFLEEQITIGMIVGLAVILAGIFLISDIRPNVMKKKAQNI